MEDIVSPQIIIPKIEPVASIAESESAVNSSSNVELFFNAKGLSAKGLFTDEGLVVLENSEASLSQTEKIQIGYRELR